MALAHKTNEAMWLQKQSEEDHKPANKHENNALKK